MHAEFESAKPCGCDPGIGWFCSQHKFVAEVREQLFEWRSQANDMAPVRPDLAQLLRTCADDIERIL